MKKIDDDITNKYAEQSFLDEKKYHEMYACSIKNPEAFWSEQAHQFLSWITPWDKTCDGNFSSGDINWFTKGRLNACFNCVDRHLAKHPEKVALIWEGNGIGESIQITYAELYEKVCRFANVLKKYGVKKGDRVCIYLPMIPEIVFVMLACARIGAIHSVVFAGFSPDSLKSRILDAGCTILITADEGLRGEKMIPLKENGDLALNDCPDVRHCFVVKRTAGKIAWNDNRDIWFHEVMTEVSSDCPIESMDSSDPLFILYTSGSTGKPKGILHSTGGYLVYAAISHQYVFDYHPEDVYWCTADIGWITGHSYGVYGPLLNGATTVLFEGVPNFPTFSRYWEIIDKYSVTIFYTAPTAIRTLRREGDEWVKKTKRTSLKLLGTVGEPINPEVWKWYFNVVGEGKCPIVDTWWQTETGGILITPIPGVTPLVPGSAAWPFFGIEPEIVNDNGTPVGANKTGKLIIKKPWPGLMQTIYGDKQRFEDTYFKEFPGTYFTGDGGSCDELGYFTITGRIDDVIKVSGHRIGTEEVESALLTHPKVSEAAVVGIPNELTGESIFAFVTTKQNVEMTDLLKIELVEQVREKIGPIAKIEGIEWANALPKTRSGKIMRRILRKIAARDFDSLGDTSTLADPGVIESLCKSMGKKL